MKTLCVVLAVLVVGAVIATAAHAGLFCAMAEEARWMSPALNSHCFLEWLWELGIT